MSDDNDTLKDIVSVGLDLKPKTLLNAYSKGVFPWPSPGLPLLWYCPQRRAVIDFATLHYSKRLKQYLKKVAWTYTIDRAFGEVMEACTERGDEGTWITDEMQEAYLEMNRLGHAHSIEVWNGDELIGGLYGMDVGGYFAGESMFHRTDNASKAAILFVIALQKKVGRSWMDIQVLTPHMEAFGAVEISRADFLKKLNAATEALKFGSGIRPFETERESFIYSDFCKLIE
jgi:leucyl/phenylalanyl-tRNA--protein transferase